MFEMIKFNSYLNVSFYKILLLVSGSCLFSDVQNNGQEKSTPEVACVEKTCFLLPGRNNK